MKTLDLGKVAISPKGVYDAGTSYDPLDLIQYNGSAYLVKKPVTGITPSDGEDYMLLVQKGMDGAQGAPGPSGIVVVATSTAGYTEADCNFLCDGTNDAATIKTAFDSLTKSNKHGTVLLLGGTYLLEKQLAIPLNCILEGIGFETTIKANFQLSSSDSVILMNGNSCIQHLVLDGSCTSDDTSHKPVILINDDCANPIIYHCKFINFYCGISDGHNPLLDSNGTTILCCRFYGNGTSISNDAFFVTGRSIVAFNYIENMHYGFHTWAGIIIGNFVTKCKYGFMVGQGIVIGNLIYNGIETYGIMAYSSENSVIAANAIINKSWPSGSKSINLDQFSHNNLVIGNMIYGKNYTDEGTGNTWVNNKYN